MTASRRPAEGLLAAIGAWPGLTLIEPAEEGNRSSVWRGDLGGRLVSVRRSRRSAASLEWELGLIDSLDRLGFRVPTIIGTEAGWAHHNGVVVQVWLDGREPESESDWSRVAAELRRLHTEGRGVDQRPGCCALSELVRQRRSVDADLDALPPEVQRLVGDELAHARLLPTSVIHGDPGPSNIRLSDSGQVGFLDFDESRIDVTWLDLANLGIRVLDGHDHQRALRLADAWEVANGWTAEPAYARRRLQGLMASVDDKG